MVQGREKMKKRMSLWAQGRKKIKEKWCWYRQRKLRSGVSGQRQREN